MATDIYLRRVPRGFEPASRIDAELIEKFPADKEVRAKITQARSGPHHRMFFALLQTVFDNQDHYLTLDALLSAIKIRLRHVDMLVMHDGQMLLQPRSIAWDNMDQQEFNEFFNAAIEIVCTEIIPGVDTALLRKTVHSLLK